MSVITTDMKWPFCKHFILKTRNCPYCIDDEAKERDRHDHIGDLFQERIVFAHSERIEDRRLFRMQSGAQYLAEIVEINSEGIHHGADDTGLRNIVWKVLDVFTVEKDNITNSTKLTCPRYGSILATEEMLSLDQYKKPFEIMNDLFIRKFFPEQYKVARFLRG